MTVPDYLRARAYLLRATEPPAPATHAFVVAHGAVEAVARLRTGTAPAAVLAEMRTPVPDLDPDVESDVAAIESGRARLVTPETDQWPTGLLRASSAHGRGVPLGLWMRGTGSLAQVTHRAVSVVGARAATSYGEHVAADFGDSLARAGVTVITSGAYGADSAALRGALGVGPVVAVLGHGVDVTYPLGHDHLFAEMIDRGGLLVSEYPFGMSPTRTRLAARGRIIAALGAATVVIEAGQRSTALSTARTARALGRRVFAVPGPITSSLSAGTNELLRTGEATALTTVDPLLDAAGAR
ncbi:MAG TPA: DNA-processing protein DprA [Pseudonocardiaceae bacterium]